jgi:ubiquinone/menaquinone biosynthesis C-methylase UbiE
MKKFTLKQVEKHYDGTIDYDKINDKTPSHDKRFIDGLAMSSIKDGAYVLDVMCRSAKAESYYNKKRKNLKFLSMDVSSRLIEEAKKRFKKEKINGKLIKLVSLTLPFKDNSFDNVISYETIEHLPDPGKIISEFGRVLKKNCEFIMSCPNTSWDWIHSLVAFLGIHHSEGPHRFVPRKEIIYYLKKSGFRIIKEKTIILVPVGPKILLKLGELVENIVGEKIRSHIALRRYFICIKK